MAKIPHSSHPLLGWATTVLFFCGFWIFSNLRDELFKKILEKCCSSMIASFVEGLAAISLPLMLAIITVGGLYFYLRAQFDNALTKITTPRLQFGEITENTEFPASNGGIKTFEQILLEIQNSGKGMLQACRVTVDRIVFDDGAEIRLGTALGTLPRWREGKIGRFNLDHGIHKQIVLTCRDLSDPRNPGSHQIMAENRLTPLFRGKSGFIYILAAAADAGDPIRLNLRFSVDEKYRLSITKSD